MEQEKTSYLFETSALPSCCPLNPSPSFLYLTGLLCDICDIKEYHDANNNYGIATIFQHHCRKCGIVVCGSCSNHKSLLPHMSSKPLRVCDECYRSLNTKSVDSVRGDLDRMNSDSSSDDSDDEDEAAERNGAADQTEVGRGESTDAHGVVFFKKCTYWERHQRLCFVDFEFERAVQFLPDLQLPWHTLARVEGSDRGNT